MHWSKWSLLGFWCLNAACAAVYCAMNIKSYAIVLDLQKAMKHSDNMNKLGLTKSVWEAGRLSTNASLIVGFCSVILFSVFSFIVMVFGPRKSWTLVVYGMAVGAAFYTAITCLLAGLIVHSQRHYAFLGEKYKLLTKSDLHIYDITFVFAYINAAMHAIYFVVLTVFHFIITDSDSARGGAAAASSPKSLPPGDAAAASGADRNFLPYGSANLQSAASSKHGLGSPGPISPSMMQYAVGPNGGAFGSQAGSSGAHGGIPPPAPVQEEDNGFTYAPTNQSYGAGGWGGGAAQQQYGMVHSNSLYQDEGREGSRGAGGAGGDQGGGMWPPGRLNVTHTTGPPSTASWQNEPSPSQPGSTPKTFGINMSFNPLGGGGRY